MRTRKTGEGIAAIVQKALEKRQIVHAKSDNSGERGGKRWDSDVGIGPSLQQKDHGADTALLDGHQ